MFRSNDESLLVAYTVCLIKVTTLNTPIARLLSLIYFKISALISCNSLFTHLFIRELYPCFLYY